MWKYSIILLIRNVIFPVMLVASFSRVTVYICDRDKVRRIVSPQENRMLHHMDMYSERQSMKIAPQEQIKGQWKE